MGEDIGEDIEDIGEDIEFKNIVCFIHVRLLADIQFRFATVHSSVTQPEPVSIGPVLPRPPPPTSPSRPPQPHPLCVERAELCCELRTQGVSSNVNRNKLC